MWRKRQWQNTAESRSGGGSPGSDRLTLGLPNAQYSESGSSVGGEEAPSASFWPESLSSKYDIGGVIGKGASSEVFSARVPRRPLSSRSTHPPGFRKGECAFYRRRCRVTGEECALKRIYKPRCCTGARATRRLRDEVRVLSTLRHPHVVEMREVFETPTELYIIMERARGGELFDRIVEKGNFSEAEAAAVMYQLLNALTDMHRRGVIHRDIKPENLLLTTRDGWELKLSDFGLVKTLEADDDAPTSGAGAASPSEEPPPRRVTPEASPAHPPEVAGGTCGGGGAKQLGGGLHHAKAGGGASSLSAGVSFSLPADLAGDDASGEARHEREIAARFGRARTHTICGSPYYMAPEVCSRERYGPAVDVWSAGVVLYILLTGSPPWERPPLFGTQPDIDVAGELGTISKDGVDLLLKMLRGQPEDRCTAQEALRHPWVGRRSCLLRESLSSPHYGSSLRAFCEKRKRASSYANLDMTPVARALGESFPTRGRGASRDHVRVKKNRRNADGVKHIAPDYDGPPPPPGQRNHDRVVSDLTSNPTEYDTMSSEDDGDDGDDDLMEDAFHLSFDKTPDPPAAPPA